MPEVDSSRINLIGTGLGGILACPTGVGDPRIDKAMFLPETLDVHLSYAGAGTLACNEPYIKLNLHELIGYYRQAKPIRVLVWVSV